MNQKPNVEIFMKLTVLISLLWVLSPSVADAGMGLDFGAIGGGDNREEACVIDTDLVIVPGPMGSPVKIFKSQKKLFVADYTKFKIKKVLKSKLNEPKSLFDTRMQKNKQKFSKSNKGKPLSVVRIRWNSGHVFFVGNDDRKTIDLYWKDGQDVTLFERLFKETKVQALDMVVDKSAGRIYVVDGLHNEIKVLDYYGRLVRSIAGQGELSAPKGLAFDEENRDLIVSDYGNSIVGLPASIKIFSRRGKLRKTITGAFSRPQGVDVYNGKVFVADAMLGQILEFDRESGEMVSTHGCFGSSEGHLLLPMDVVVDEVAQRLYVADNRNGRVTALPLNPQP